MHEISLVRSIFKTLEEAFPAKIEKVRTIYLKVGLLSNVQPILMQNAFEAVLQDELKYAKACLQVEVLPILIKCDACGSVTEVQQYKFMCTCGKLGKNIIQGEELMISKVEFEDA